MLSLSWDQARIISIGWTYDERLVVLNEEGAYRLYDLQGDYMQHSLGSEAAETGVVEARIFESGLVALIGSMVLLEVMGWDGKRAMALSNPGLSEPPNCWTAVPPEVTISRGVEVLLSVDATIISVDSLETTDQRLARGPFSRITPSPNGKTLALLTFDGVLLVVSSDFQRSMTEFDSKTVPSPGAEGPVRQVVWCGMRSW